LIRSLEREKVFEIILLVAFSVFILVFFFALLSMNGMVLGNDPAVHLQRAQSLLSTGIIPISDIAWTPPLFHIVLAAFITFTGATSVGQTIFLVKSVAALVNWLLIFAVYLIGAKFFSRKIGFLASFLLFLSFPLYELNFWGGYTTVLSLGFLCMLFLYLSSEKKSLGATFIIFIFTFSLVLTHQLTTFLALFIFPPFILVMLVKYKGRYPRAWVAALLGGVIAFAVYYLLPILPYLGSLIDIVFFQLKEMVYQIPSVYPQAFMVNFGFIIFLAFSGLVIAFFKLRARKSLSVYLLLSLAFFVPLFFSQSYLLGFYLPFQRFVYYLLPTIAVFGAVAFSFALDRFSVFYSKYKNKWKNPRLKIVAATVVVLICALLLFRAGVVYGKIMESSVFYSTSDIKGFDAGTWLKTNYPGPATVVVTEVPGSWFAMFSGKSIIAQTDPIVERNVIATSVLDLSYEFEHPLTIIRAYESKGAISDEDYVSLNSVWQRVTYSSADGDFLNYTVNGVSHSSNLSNFRREIIFEDQGYPKKLVIKYSNNDVALTQTILVQNDSYPLDVSWTVTSLKNEITDVAFQISSHFDLFFSFKEAYLPGLLDWDNPWTRPSEVNGNEWAVIDFSRTTLTDNFIGFYDDKNAVAFAIKFAELPDWGNIGALTSRQIDALRFQYNFDKISANNSASFAYQTLTFSHSSFAEMKNLSELKGLFDFKPAAAFEVQSRDYHDSIRENNIDFIVYDKNQLDTKLVRAKILELVYSNDRYVIFKINNNP
jgi:asparagine N-glycosylation enzyme membrane subunit Stt3